MKRWPRLNATILSCLKQKHIFKLWLRFSNWRHSFTKCHSWFAAHKWVSADYILPTSRQHPFQTSYRWGLNKQVPLFAIDNLYNPRVRHTQKWGSTETEECLGFFKVSNLKHNGPYLLGYLNNPLSLEIIYPTDVSALPSTLSHLQIRTKNVSGLC